VKELKNASFALFGSIAGVPLQILGGVLVARSLGPELFGNYSFAVTFSYFFACFAEGGLSILATRELARNHREPGTYLTSLVCLKLLLSIFFFAAMVWSGWLWEMDDRQLLTLFLVGVGNFFSSLCIFLVGMARAYERMKIEGIINFSQALIFVVLMTGLFFIGQSAEISLVSACFMVSYLLTALLGGALLGKYFRRMSRFDLPLTISLAKEALTLSVGWIVLLTYSRVGVIVLEAGSIPAEVGYFNASLRLALNVGIIPNILAGAFMPLLARTIVSDRSAFARGASSLSKYLLVGGLLLAVPLGLTAEGVVQLIYGAKYQAAAPSFAILMAAMFFFFVSFGPKTFMESSGRQIGWGVAAGVGLVVNVILTAWLAPAYGAIGASLGLLGANLAIALLSFRFCVGWVPWSAMTFKCGKTIFGGTIMAITIWLLLSINWFFAGVVGGLIFIVSLLALGEISWSELRKFFTRQSAEG